MATLHQRNRIVVFRLTQEEHQSLQSACIAAGSRSLSDYTRTQLLTLMSADASQSLVERRFGDIDRKLSALHQIIQRVSERIESPEDRSVAADGSK